MTTFGMITFKGNIFITPESSLSPHPLASTLARVITILSLETSLASFGASHTRIHTVQIPLVAQFVTQHNFFAIHLFSCMYL